jgi:mycothiol synthase
MIPDGLEIRPPTFEDIDDVTEMLVSTDLADTGTSESDADLIRDQWSSHGFQPSEDAWVITDPNRAIVAYGNVTPDGESKIKSWGMVHHDHRGRGLGGTLLDRMEARASERLRGTPAAKLHTAVISPAQLPTRSSPPWGSHPRHRARTRPPSDPRDLRGGVQ